MSYDLGNKKLDISGPKGSVFAVIGIAKSLVNMVEGASAGKEWIDSLDLSNMLYEDVLREVIAKTGISLVSPHDLGIPEDLYTIESTNDYL